MLVLYASRIGIWRCLFCGERKPGVPRKSPRSIARTSNKLNPMTSGRNPTQATLVRGERSHHCAIPAPLYFFFQASQSLIRLAVCRPTRNASPGNTGLSPSITFADTKRKRMKGLGQKTNVIMPQPWLEPNPVDPESSASANNRPMPIY